MRILLVFSAFILIYACNSSSDEKLVQKEEGDSVRTDLDTALSRLNQTIIDYPNDPESYRMRARYYYNTDQPARALEDLNRAISIDSSDASLIFERGELFFSTSEFDKAKEEFERCVRIDNQSVDCLLKLGEMNIHLRNYSKAIEQINNALRVNEQLPFAYYMKGRIYKETGDTVLAASSYQTAIEVDPDFYDAYIEVGLLYTAAKSDLAIEYYKTALELRPRSVEAMYNLAYYYQLTGMQQPKRFDLAFELYDRILEVAPDNATAPFSKGFVYLEYMQEYDSAVTYFTQAADLYPGYFQAYYNRGLALESLDRKEEALADYNRALSLQPDYTPAAIAKNRVLGE